MINSGMIIVSSANPSFRDMLFSVVSFRFELLDPRDAKVLFSHTMQKLLNALSASIQTGPNLHERAERQYRQGA